MLGELDRASIDAVVTDPPYELGFMGKRWDGTGVAFEPDTWFRVLDVLKPGAHLVAFGGTRTFHRMACAIEDAGFEIRDTLMWLYGTGFPKSLDVSKAIDRAAGAAREVVGPSPWASRGGAGLARSLVNDDNWQARGDGVTAPATPEAAQWQGWGTALKPSYEPILLCRKPLGAKTVSANVLAHGTGAINVDACRVPMQSGDKSGHWTRKREIGGNGIYGGGGRQEVDHGNVNPAGARWPANVVHDGSEEVEASFAAFGERPGQQGRARTDGAAQENGVYGALRHITSAPEPRGDTGSASRFFYSAKASAADRAGSKHPTVKPLALMRWLCRMVTPPGGRVLDPFAGSGTTLQAAEECGFQAIGIEMNETYQEDIVRRMEGVQPALV